MQVVLDTVGAKIDRAATFALKPFFAGKGFAAAAFFVIRPELGDGKGCRRAADAPQGAEMPAPGLPGKKNRKQSSAENNGQDETGGADWRTVKSANNLGRSEEH